ncbi:SDR family oxidoreductase [Jiella sp. MQZ9-1]|uniref:SDR family oxidoreductase n=1 Tax=Jiella flava TaxID=2816857 RepID=A0A939G131_9HYPH|nr:SDR family oxidoreductase [Jiella flava]MBO0664554.1 SDR family oxidoreductase [Jiella flava]MCD2473175.1 SDR family oxidoreductase [Jiella flava]
MAGSRGIGGAITEALAANGTLVHTFSRSGTAPVLQPGAVHFAGDLSSADDIRAFAKRVEEVSPQLDILVNNSGHAPASAFDELEDADWQAGFELLFLSVVRTTQCFLPLLRRASSGAVIVNVSTFAALQPDLDFPVSSVLRLALTNYAKAYATVHAGEGIRMLNVLPGFVDSYPMKAGRLARIPSHRYANAREFGGAVATLASPELSYLTGTDILIDGGLVAAGGRLFDVEALTATA